MTGGQPFASRDFTGQPLVNFDNATSAEVLKLINKLSHKSSPRDVLPASLLKSCCDLFALILAHLANLSFKQGVFPTAFKIAQVLPLLKKSGLDRSVPANYRPIANLNTISTNSSAIAERPHCSVGQCCGTNINVVFRI